MKKEKASNGGNVQAVVSLQGKMMSNRKIAFRVIENGDSRNVLWKTEYCFKDGFPLEQSDMDYIANRIKKNFIRDGVVSEIKGGDIKRKMTRLEMISVLNDFERKHPGCLGNPEYYDSLEDKPFDCEDVLWVMQGWDELKDAMEKVGRICFEWNIPDNKTLMNMPKMTVNDFCKKYNMPPNVGRNLLKLGRRVMALGEELKVLA